MFLFNLNLQMLILGVVIFLFFCLEVKCMVSFHKRILKNLKMSENCIFFCPLHFQLYFYMIFASLTLALAITSVVLEGPKWRKWLSLQQLVDDKNGDDINGVCQTGQKFVLEVVWRVWKGRQSNCIHIKRKIFRKWTL